MFEEHLLKLPLSFLAQAACFVLQFESSLVSFDHGVLFLLESSHVSRNHSSHLAYLVGEECALSSLVCFVLKCSLRECEEVLRLFGRGSEDATG